MNIFITISILSFAGMFGLVYSRLWRVRRGLHDATLEAPGLYEIVKPTVEISKHTTRELGRFLWDKLMALSHTVSLALAGQFLRLANFVKGKRTIARNRGSVSFMWREMACLRRQAEEIDKLKSNIF
jgi:hypothetical protein